MYLHTSSLPHQVPPTLAAYLSLVYFHQTRYDIQEELLDRFMRLEKSRLNEEKVNLLQVSLYYVRYNMKFLITIIVCCLTHVEPIEF